MPDSKQQRITARAHKGVGRQHGAEADRSSFAERALRHPHDYARREGLAAAARPALMVVDAEEVGVAHKHPVAAREHDALVWRAAWLPSGAGSLARHRIGPELTV